MTFKHVCYTSFVVAVVLVVCTLLYVALPWLRQFSPVNALLIEVLFVSLVGGTIYGFVGWIHTGVEGRRIRNRRFAPTTEGNYDAYLQKDNTFAQPKVGTAVQPVPHTWSPHTQITGSTAPQLDAPGKTSVQEIDVEQPSQHWLMNQLQENALEVSPGINAETGEVLKLNIVDAVHFKLIGSSGFGKSCLAAALLHQATALNSPDRLQIALLDLEHKTSRLFEDLPHVLEVQDGRRRVPLASTNADEVAGHLQLLRGVLKERAQIGDERELQRLPVILMYVEEMLSLQYEVDEDLLSQMLSDLSVLALRARKYNMFLLACAQTDYSTRELRNAQKQFRSRFAFAIDTTAARAAGFMNTELIKHNFMHAVQGDAKYVVEYPGFSGIGIAPKFDVKQLLLQREPSRSERVQDVFTPPELVAVNSTRTRVEQGMNTPLNTDEHTWQAKVEQVQDLREHNWGKIAIIEKIWGAKRGGTEKYRQAEAEYDQIVRHLEEVRA